MDDELEGEDNKQWRCGKAGSVNLQRVSSIVRDIGEPCLHQSPRKRSKMLKPEKWRATFDGDGKVFGFQKALKLIVLGGVDPSIRAEVWEFLLGCYALGSTTEYRRQLRMARRERYMDLIKQCQKMHSSIGTGSLAYVVGSKVMDVRNTSKDNGKSEAEIGSRSASHDANGDAEILSDWNNKSTDASHANHRASSSDSADLVTVRGSTDSAAYDSPHAMSSSDPYNCFSPKAGIEAHTTQHLTGSCFDFPSLPVTDLFERNEKDEKVCGDYDDRVSMESKYSLVDENMHSFQINNNVDLIMELNGSPSNDVSHASKSDTKVFDSADQEQLTQSRKPEYKSKLNRLRISDIPETSIVNATKSEVEAVSEDRVSEWLWTLHRIVVDVVRTDSHLEFYEDAKNMARMSDILAVYAWVDPATGYCQGMSDLLSPFVVLYEDNADAFWCFEMLLRRMRENFQMEGPTGVMKQLEALWRILELTDRETFAHLSLIGAESLHFAFRMLLVLFRRELSFSEALCMWEMMWAADFHESMARELEEHCLEPLVLQLPRDSGSETGEESVESNGSSKGGRSQSKNGIVERPVSDSNGMKSASTHQSHPFCGLTRNFWSRNDRMQNCTLVTSTVTSTRSGDDDIPVYCVAAILIINRHKIIKETHSIDDMIKIFNDNMLNINIKRCIRTAIKLRKKYFYKIIRHKRTCSSEI